MPQLPILVRPTTPVTPTRPAKTTASSLLATFSPTKSDRASSTYTSPADRQSHQPHNSDATPGPERKGLQTMAKGEADKISYESGESSIKDSIPSLRLPFPALRASILEHSQTGASDHVSDQPSPNSSSMTIKDSSIRSLSVPELSLSASPAIKEQSRILAFNSPTLNFPLGSDARNGSGRSLRARNELTLSNKAKENLNRGFHDPRSFASPEQKVIKSPRSPQKLATAQHHALLRRRQDAFLRHYKDLFLPLLPDANHLTRVSLFDQTTIAGQATVSTVSEYRMLHRAPDGMTATLKRHQLEGLSFLAWLKSNAMNGILGDEMGLGKTLQTLALLQMIKSESQETYKPSIVVCPLSVLDTWQNEAKKFAPQLSTKTFYGPRSQRTKLRSDLRRAISARAVDLVIVSYETYDSELAALRLYKWTCAILDEGHKIKNADSKTSHSLHKISADFRLLLTGTPIQNDLFELWSLFHWLLPDVFNSSTRQSFQDSFNLAKESGIDVQFISQARRLLELIMLRRTKEDVADDAALPPMEEIVLSVPMAPIQHAVYKDSITKSDHVALRRLDSASPLEPGRASQWEYQDLLNLLMRLRQIAIHPYLLPGVQPDPYFLDSHTYESSGKFVVLKEIFAKLVLKERKKIIVFSGFKGVLDCVEDVIRLLALSNANLQSLRIDGDSALAHRNLCVKLFQDPDNSYRVMLVSLRAGGLGLTLTAAEAIVFMDLDWNPQVMMQAAARSHRIGQTKPVTVYKLLSSGTVEQQMERRIAKKLYLSARVTESFKNVEASEFDQDLVETDAHGRSLTSGVAQFSMHQLASMIHFGSSSISSTIDFEDLKKWTYDEMIANCQRTNSTEEIDQEAYSKWLEQKEHVDTSIFEGVNQKNQNNVDSKSTDEQVSDDEQIRATASETVSNLDNDESNAIVSTNEADTDEPISPVNEKSFGHLDVCLFCDKSDHRELVECQSCPKVYHQECLDEDDTLPESCYASLSKQCPAHRCCTCHQSATNVGGLLFHCVKCPRAFCEQHVDWLSCTQVGFELQQYVEIGYEARRVFYVECSLCCKSPVTQLTPDSVSDAETEIDADSIHCDQAEAKAKRSGDAMRLDESPTKKARQTSPIVIEID